MTRRLLPPTWLLLAILAMLLLHFLLPVAWIIPPGWNLSGLAFVLAGVAINLVADRAFRQARTTVKPFEASSALVTGGVFRFSRNPMYLGFALIVAGTAVLLGTLAPCLVVPAFFILMVRVYVQAEERMLEARFGAQWLAYRARTRRWL